jgi:F-type H+-transporting ATPase subunit b
MELDWTTFALEIINFLALVWILKRFLYRPVLAILAQRRAGIERLLSAARETQSRASILKSQFEGRLADWEQEKAAARARFEAEVAAERARQMELLSRDLATERERGAAQDAHRQETLKRELGAKAAAEARQFASQLLARLAGPDLEARLVKLFIEELATLPDERVTPLRAGHNGNGQGVVVSAYSLSEEQRRLVSGAIADRLGVHGHLEFVEDSDLLAGVRVSLGAWQLDLSLAGELGIFSEASHLAP